MIFSFETDGSEVVRSFISRASLRFGLGFHGKFYQKGNYTVVVMNASFPPVWRYLSLGILGGLFVFKGVTPWMYTALVPMVIEVFLFPSVQFRLMKRGLRKAGYKGVVRRVGAEETLEVAFR